MSTKHYFTVALILFIAYAVGARYPGIAQKLGVA